VLNQDSKFWIPQTACEGEHDLVQICNMPSSEEINSQDSVLSQASVTAIQQRFHNWPSCQRRVTSGNQTTEDRYWRRMLLKCEHIPIVKLQQRIQLNMNMWMLRTVLFFSRGRLPQGYPFEAFTNNNCSRLGTPALCLWGWGNFTGHLHPSVKVRRHWPEMSFTMYKYRLQVRCENFRPESSSITSYKISKDPES
jgi:hypothetical protein